MTPELPGMGDKDILHEADIVALPGNNKGFGAGVVMPMVAITVRTSSWMARAGTTWFTVLIRSPIRASTVIRQRNRCWQMVVTV
ncbi:hypothetical protein GCM10025791_42300 [Halioxenophilus aromaticivorans]|uniref:Uncharacterized protein n=1 Tax=Halioxenophilus aromaticivorans TaxID=1306992 RepID=A0AAV3U9G5_9ALTE